MATSPSRVNSGTVPISRMYVRTGSFVFSSMPGVSRSSEVGCKFDCSKKVLGNSEEINPFSSGIRMKCLLRALQIHIVGAWEEKVAIYATKYRGNIESQPALIYDKQVPLAIRKAL